MIKSDVVLLRAVEPADADIMYQWENDISLWSVSNTLTPFSYNQLKIYANDVSRDLYQSGQLRLMIDYIAEGENEVAGMIDLFDFDPFHSRAGVGIMINKKWRNRRVATEALRLFIEYSFLYLGLHQLYCNIGADNELSVKLFEGAGFQKSGVKKEWLKRRGKYVDELFFQLINR
ncbi:GNAT family protein [Marinilabiliaceae bacterium ANBcel2]|nr:GNAT family protein [Marinilabiliaceae bacterium ANBcel2]